MEFNCNKYIYSYEIDDVDITPADFIIPIKISELKIFELEIIFLIYSEGFVINLINKNQ